VPAVTSSFLLARNFTILPFSGFREASNSMASLGYIPVSSQLGSTRAQGQDHHAVENSPHTENSQSTYTLVSSNHVSGTAGDKAGIDVGHHEIHPLLL